MKIAIDLDDVLSNSVEALLLFYNKNYEPIVKKSDLGKYSYWGFLGDTREAANKKYFEFTKSGEFTNSKPLKGAQEAVKKLSKRHDLYVITGRPYFTKRKTEEWLNKFFPGSFKKVYFTNRRRNMNNFSAYWGKPKAVICDEIGAEVLIDDLAEYVRESNHLRVYIFNKIWDQGIIPDHAKIVDDWDEITRDLS